MDAPADILQRTLPLSRALARLLDADPSLADEIRRHLGEALTPAALHGFLPGDLDEASLKPALRRLKRQALARVVVRDLAGLADLAEVTESMTLIAEAAVETARSILSASLAARYGTPRNAQGEPQELLVIGMGKLGGRELNVSSDIDLIFVYPEDGETDGSGEGGKRISNFDFFTRLGRSLINAIAEVTGDGQVFRVDMRLRPNGDSGPLVCSFDMLENYFITQGREWERYAWIKAQVLPGGDAPAAAREQWLAALEAIRQPFVFRRYLDFGCIDAMRELHRQIRREVARKDMAGNIKLGPGGIREIEFIAQVFQLIRGGRDTQLQIKPTLHVLALLAGRRQLSDEAVRELTAAYLFLRRLEHRLQYLDDAQTHSLPGTAEDQAIVAQAMGFASYDALQAELDDHRVTVSQHFDGIFADHGQSTAPDGVWPPCVDSDDGGNETAARLTALGYREASASAQHLAAVHAGNRYQQMPDPTCNRFDALVPRVVEACAVVPNPDEALSRILDLLEAVSRRAAYLSLLLEYPESLQKLAQLASASLWAANFLQQHPILLDELLDARLLEATPDWPAFGRQMKRALDEIEPDTESQMDLLREAQHAQLFRLLAQDVGGLLTLETLADHLSALADLMLELALRYAWRKVAKHHCETPRFAIVSYGKLGGKELGYASDLDLVFLYDDPAPEAQENYARLATRLNTWLSSQTAAGLLYETDLRLRPNGDSGLIVCSLDAFRKYQAEAAWLWEHQALTRARFSAGDRAIGGAFEAIRNEILRQPRDLENLRREIAAMRRKMSDAHATNGAQAETTFDLKHDPGGLIDVEFIVQYLVLGHARQHPQLTGNLGNIALLRLAGELGLIPAALAETVRNAYRDYRRMQHRARLNNAKARVTPEEVADRVAAVRALWQLIFET